MSRTGAPGISSTGIGRRTTGGPDTGTPASAPRLTGSSSRAPRSGRRSARRCHAPPRPGRLSDAVASKRIAYGSAAARCSSAAVIVEYTTARARIDRAARRAASASTRSVTAM